MDIKLNYIQKGKGFPLMLLHGNGEDLSYFEHQIEHFSKKYKVIAIDTRGHGKSPRGSKPFTIAQFAEDLCDFMTERSIDKAHILGFSDGGNIALTFALKYPAKIDKLILNGANLDPSGVKAHVQIPIIAGYRIASAFAQRSSKAKRNSEMLSLMVNEPDIKPEQLNKLKMPTLVMAGTRDMIKTEHTKLIAKNISDCRLTFIDGDHFIARKKFEEFNEAVDKFLKEKRRSNEQYY